MIFDCFPFFNELETLEIRLNELYDTVDYFVLSEATKTHSGQDKPLYYADNISRFEKFKDKILHVVVNDMPSGDDHWARERYQRDKIAEALIGKAHKTDLMIISDADEVPKASAIKELTVNDDQLANLCMDCFQYYYNLKGRNQWTMGKACNYHTFKKYKCASDIRNSGAHINIQNAGWHFGYIGGFDRVEKKIKSFAHQEFNTEFFMNHNLVRAYVSMGMSIWDKNTISPECAGNPYWKYTTITEEKFPKYLVENKEKLQVPDVNFTEYPYDTGSLRKMGEILINTLSLDGDIVEIGSHEGLSSVYLANLFYPQKIYLIDNHNPNLRRNINALTLGNVEFVENIENRKIKVLHLNDVSNVEIPKIDGMICGYKSETIRQNLPNVQMFGENFWWTS